MKKLIGILTILLLATGVFGQINLGDLSSIETYNGINDWKSTDNLAHFTTKFQNHEFYYILAYEPNCEIGCYDNTERSVYLYCIEKTSGSRWRKASDVIMTNHYYDSNNYEDVDFYLYNEHSQNSSNSYVTMDGFNVIFTLNIHKKVNGSATVTSQSFKLGHYRNKGSKGYGYKLLWKPNPQMKQVND